VFSAKPHNRRCRAAQAQDRERPRLNDPVFRVCTLGAVGADIAKAAFEMPQLADLLSNLGNASVRRPTG